MKNLKVVVLTQSDYFYIPLNIYKVSKVCEVVMVVECKSKGALVNKKIDMLKWFGPFQCAKIAIKTIFRIVQGFVDKISLYNIYGGCCSIKHITRKIRAEYNQVVDVNSLDFIKKIKEISPDLIVSYSAPQVIKSELLSIPKHGILNVHGALLPNYRGIMPSFWYLFNNEKIGGATVHYMSCHIDDGAICAQKRIDISDCKTMLQLMERTKKVGGELMVDVVQKISNGTLETKENDVEHGSYYSWPSVVQFKKFRKDGKKLC